MADTNANVIRYHAEPNETAVSALSKIDVKQKAFVPFEKCEIIKTGESTFERIPLQTSIDEKIDITLNTIPVGDGANGLVDSGVTVTDVASSDPSDIIKRIEVADGSLKASIVLGSDNGVNNAGAGFKVENGSDTNNLDVNVDGVFTTKKIQHEAGVNVGDSATIGNVNTILFEDHEVTATSTGFQYPRTVDLSYNGTTSKVTVQPCAVYWCGVKLTEFKTVWESPAHGTIAPNTSQWLYYNGTDYLWALTIPNGFRDMPIARVYRDGVNVCIRECHGFMDSETHEAMHYGLGAFLRSGGNLSSYTTGSTTATNRRPKISDTAVADEDCVTDLPSLTTNAYARLTMSGSSTATITVDNAEIVPLSDNNPYYYNFTGGIFVETLFPTNAYGKIFVIAIPVTDDATCQKARYVFIAPQQVSTTLATIQAVTFSSLSLGQIVDSVQEFVPIAEIIIRYAATNWTITSVSKLTGSLKFQQSTPSSSIPTLAQVLGASPDGGGLIPTNIGNAVNATDVLNRQTGDGRYQPLATDLTNFASLYNVDDVSTTISGITGVRDIAVFNGTKQAWVANNFAKSGTNYTVRAADGYAGEIDFKSIDAVNTAVMYGYGTGAQGSPLGLSKNIYFRRDGSIKDEAIHSVKVAAADGFILANFTDVKTLIGSAFTQMYSFGRVAFQMTGGNVDIPKVPVREADVTQTFALRSGAKAPLACKITGFNITFLTQPADVNVYYKINNGSWVLIGSVTVANGYATYLLGSPISLAQNDFVRISYTGSNGESTGIDVDVFVREASL